MQTKRLFFFKRERKEKKAFISLDLIIRSIIQLKKSDPVLENKCPLVFLKLKAWVSLPSSCYSVSDCFTLHKFNTMYSLTFITYSTSFLKTVVIVWLNPFPPAKSCVVSAGHTSGHRGHFVSLTLKPSWTAPQSKAGLSMQGTTAIHVVLRLHFQRLEIFPLPELVM